MTIEQPRLDGDSLRGRQERATIGYRVISVPVAEITRVEVARGKRFSVLYALVIPLAIAAVLALGVVGAAGV